jgi:hypothetical protein
MHIENDELLTWIGETLEQMAQEQGLIVTKCPHCDCPVRFPLVARQSDIELFSDLIRSSQEIMRRYGITGAMLADIRAECLIAIAKKDRHD